MKKISSFFALAIAAVTLFSGCGPTPFTGKPGSSGKTLEMLVVAKQSVYSGTTKQVIDSIFASPQIALNQPEPCFDLVHISPSSFEDNAMFQSHRNILILDVNPQNINKIYLEQDKWSTPQIVIRITASDKRSLDSMLLVKNERMLSEYYNQEYRRMDKVFSSAPGIKIQNKIKGKYGFSLTIPEEFELAKMREESDFTWLLKRTKDFDLYLYIFSRPATSSNDFEQATILDNIDTMLRRYVPGPSEGSYPGVERRLDSYSRDVVLADDLNAVETRGLWCTHNDFMGGPYVSYTFSLPGSDLVYTVMGCVYSPSGRNRMVMKRDLLMQLDGICRSIKTEKTIAEN
jgi:hypothetical protein